jgi:disulfide bond formation protein DsbB
MFAKLRSFFIATLVALLAQIVVIFIFQITYRGLDCGLLEQRICSFPIFLKGITELVASVNVYSLGLPTILLALILGASWRMYKDLRESGMRRRDILTPSH